MTSRRSLSIWIVCMALAIARQAPTQPSSAHAGAAGTCDRQLRLVVLSELRPPPGSDALVQCAIDLAQRSPVDPRDVDEQNVRSRALQVLREAVVRPDPSPRVVQALRVIARRDTEAVDVRLRAAGALRSVNDTDLPTSAAINTLVEALLVAPRTVEVTLQAIQLADGTGGDLVAPSLHVLLADRATHPALRLAAAQAFALFGGLALRRPMPEFTVLAFDAHEDPRVRRASATALRAFVRSAVHPEATNALVDLSLSTLDSEADDLTRAEILNALAGLQGDKAFRSSAIMTRLASWINAGPLHPVVSEATATLIARHPGLALVDEASTPVLEALAARLTDPNAALETTCREALKRVYAENTDREVGVLRPTLTRIAQHAPEPLRGALLDALDKAKMVSDGKSSSLGHHLRMMIVDHWMYLLVLPLALLTWLANLVVLHVRPLALLATESWKVPIKVWSVEVPLNYLTLSAFFQHHPRVLDAWVAKHLPTARATFEHHPVIAANRRWLDVEVVMDGTAVREPKPVNAAPFFSSPRSVVLILGEGGSGKTALACRLGDWAMQGMLCASGGEACAAIPIVVEEAVAEGAVLARDKLVETLTGKLCAAVQVSRSPSPSFVRALLASGRLMVIADGYSEWNPATRQTFDPGQDGFPIGRLVVTSRAPGPFASLGAKVVKTRRLDDVALYRFVREYIASKHGGTVDVDVVAAGWPQVVRGLRGGRMTILFARMYAEMISGAPSDAEPYDAVLNMRDLVLGYVDRINKNCFPRVMIRRAAMLVAWACVREEFRSTGAPRSRILEVLEAQAEVPSADPEALLAALVQIGLVELAGAAQDVVRFALDPLAEHLAAIYVTERCDLSKIPEVQSVLAREEAQPARSRPLTAALRVVMPRPAEEGAAQAPVE